MDTGAAAGSDTAQARQVSAHNAGPRLRRGPAFVWRRRSDAERRMGVCAEINKISGVTKMLKFLMTALVLGAFATSVLAITGVVGQAQAQYRPCTNAPKNYVPCPLKPQGPQLPQPKGK